MSSENIDNMNDTGARGSLNGVEELVTFLGCASSNDRSAFSKRANIIFECRTCFTLFRKADGFMRHVTRCDSSRGTDAESEPERRTLYVSPAPAVPSAGRVSRVVPLKKPISTGAAYLQSTPPAPVLQQEAVIKQPPIKPRGRPPKAEKMNVAKLPVKKEDDVFPTPTPPTVVMATGNGTQISPSRAPKRAYNRKVTPVLTPQKIQKTDNNDGGEEAVSVSSKSAKSDDPDLSAEIRPSRMRKTPKWLEDSAFVV
uniref:C2H2-type domain-containing protein n=1 Tax=Haemonchus contortus TaxID=6289 RepID=A0A7I4XUE4_HAECO